MRAKLGSIFVVSFLLCFVGAEALMAYAVPNAPRLLFASPIASQTVSGILPLVVTADAPGLTAIQFQIDGTNYGSPITAGSCSAQIDTRPLTDGLHVASVLGTDPTQTQPVLAQVAFTSSNAVVQPPTPTPTPTPPPTSQAQVVLSKNPVHEGEIVTATARDATGNAIAGIVWSVEHSFMAAIDQTGRITNVALTGPVAGRTQANTGIIASFNGSVIATVQLTVLAGPATPLPVLTSMTVAPSALLIGETAQGTARDAAGQPIAVGWASSSPIASVSATGAVTAISAGTATISATANGVTLTAPVVVSAPAPPPAVHPAVDLTATARAQIAADMAALIQKYLTPQVVTPPTFSAKTTTVVRAYSNGSGLYFSIALSLQDAAALGITTATPTGTLLRIIK
jgi:trimeric autotransporter adhesin